MAKSRSRGRSKARGRSKGTRAVLRPRGRKVARSRGSGRIVRLSRRTGGTARFSRSGTTTPYGKGTPSIKRRDVYDALRRKGYKKSKAARIANAVANGTNGRGVRGPAGGTKRGSRRG